MEIFWIVHLSDFLHSVIQQFTYPTFRCL